MAWDSKRPVPWKYIFRMIGIFTVLMNVVLYLGNKENYGWQVLLTSLVFAAFYTVFTIILAKFGMDPVAQRERRAEMATERRAMKLAAGPSKPGRSRKSRTGEPEMTLVGRARPAPTARTNAGNRQPKKR